jgi:hydroxyacylglutathione hydrolase
VNVIPFVHEGLGNSSYLIELPDREALLVDPDRSVDRYLRAAEDRGLQITAAIETHLHADFISGAHELGTRGVARVLVPSGAQARFPHVAVQAGDPVPLAGAALEPIASPGHTPEHLSYVLRLPGRAPLLFTGGSLIVGGAARTDLIAPEQTHVLTRRQHATVRHAFEALPDETVLYPTHGGGSFCSVGGGSERTSTLGHERATNPIFGIEDPAAFEAWFVATFPAAPAYFSRLRPINQAGPRPRSQIAMPRALPAGDFAEARELGALVVDVRPVGAYMAEHIPGALSNPFRDSFATWLGWLVELETPLLFVLGDEPLERVLDESLLVGFERFVGWLDGGVPAWTAAGLPVERAALVGGAGARRALADGAVALDVREPAEYAAGHVDGALPVPLGSLAQRLEQLPRDRPIVVYCGHGERAASGVSLLERAGIGPLLNLEGGFEAWRASA